MTAILSGMCCVARKQCFVGRDVCDSFLLLQLQRNCLAFFKCVANMFYAYLATISIVASFRKTNRRGSMTTAVTVVIVEGTRRRGRREVSCITLSLIF